MIFVPCRNGVSHNEAEFVTDAHMVSGASVLLAAVVALAQS
jgi:N-carbamoyl-L-amino-acid hydrolase